MITTMLVSKQPMHIEYEHQSVASSSFDHYSFDGRFWNRVGLCPNGCPGRVVFVDFPRPPPLHVAIGARQGGWWMARGKWIIGARPFLPLPLPLPRLALAIAFLALALALLAFVLANAFCRRLSLGRRKRHGRKRMSKSDKISAYVCLSVSVSVNVSSSLLFSSLLFSPLLFSPLLFSSLLFSSLLFSSLHSGTDRRFILYWEYTQIE